MLSVEGVHAGYGAGEVLRGVDIEVKSGEIVAVIGTNGAGKTTLFRCIMGMLSLRKGEIRVNGSVLGKRGPEYVASLGVGYVPEGRRVFPELTVKENLSVGAYLVGRKAAESTTKEVYALFPELEELGGRRAGNLSGGQQQMLAVGRALVMSPKLVLLDEPSLGLAPVIVDSLYERIAMLRQKGVTVVIVEQNAQIALEVSDRAYVLSMGRIVKEGKSGEFMDDSAVQDAYLGVGGEFPPDV